MGYRLAVAGMNVAYGDSSTYPLGGPFPTSLTFSTYDDDNTYVVDIAFDADFSYDFGAENSGFYSCEQADFADCDAIAGAWNLVSLVQ